MKPIINSLLDNDAYTFYMCQFILSRFKGTIAKYKYKCRNGTGFPKGISLKDKHLFVEMMNRQIDSFCKLTFKEDELQFLKATGKFKDNFIDFLRTLTLDRSHIKCTCYKDNLYIEIEGPIEQVIWYETPVLAINSELHFRYNYIDLIADNSTLLDRLNVFSSQQAIDNLQLYDFTYSNNTAAYKATLLDAKQRLYAKIAKVRKANLAGFNIIDFGTRRRASFDWQDEVIAILKKEIPNVLKGTSNCYLAMKHDIPMIGTMAHQLFQMYQQTVGAGDSQLTLLKEWKEAYGNKLLIALSDIFGFEAFLSDFRFLAGEYSGARHDSGNPYIWCEKLMEFYRYLSIDAKEKQAVFSDGLTVDKAINLYATFYRKIQVAIAIGTNLTNDTEVEALQIVIKLVEFNHGPVAKVSDSPGKGMCESKEYEEYINHIVAQKERVYKQWLENKPSYSGERLILLP